MFSVILFVLLKLQDTDDNYDDNWNVSSVILSASMSSRIGATSGCDVGDGVHV